jgi:hypothetical protein
MKIIKGNFIYIELEDLSYVVKKGIGVPKNLIQMTIEQGYVFADKNNMYKFIGYKDPKIIEYFKEQDFVIDYEEIKDLSIDKLIQKCDRYIDDRDLLSEEYSMMDTYSKEKYKDDLKTIDDLEYKYYQVNKYLLFKSGDNEFGLPEEVYSPKKESILKNIFKKK